MSAPRSLQVLRARWWVLAAVALVGGGVALGAVQLRNSRLEPAFEALAPIAVLRLDGEADAAYDARLNTAVAQAHAAVSDHLSEDLSITSDLDQGAIQFWAKADDPDEAMTQATDLRAAYLNSRPADAAEDQLAPVLQSIATEIAVVQADLADLNKLRTDEVTEVQRNTLADELEAATRDLVSVQARLLDPSLTTEQQESLRAQEAAAEATIGAISPLLEALPASSETVADTQARLEALVLQRRLRDLEAQYIATSLRQSQGVTEGLVGTPVLVDRSGNPVHPLLSIASGLAAGVVLAALAVVGLDRYRDPLRSVDDVPGLAVVRINRRPRRSAGSANWYERSKSDGRRSDIQALRARIDRLVGSEKLVLTAGVDIASADLLDVAVDLAAGVAATGRTVMLMDTRLGQDSPPAWEGAGPTVAEMLSSQDRAVPDRSAMKRLLWDRPRVAPNLLLVPPGTVDGDPVDAVAGLHFSTLAEEARDLVDLLILAVGDVADPVTEAVAVRTRLAILTAQKDHTRKRDVVTAIAKLAQLGVTVGAIALLVGRSSARKPIGRS